jgi:Domain of unknown function (DUF4389)
MYPVRYEADYVEPQNRAKAFFRWLLIIPWYILGSVYALVAGVVAFLAWFALLFTGRYPQGLYNFNAGFLRFTGRAYAFGLLQTEDWPPFGFEEAREYPIRVPIDPPLEKYNRWKTGFRLILGIPVMFMVTLFQYLYGAAAVIAWFHIVFMGRTSGGIHNALTVGLAYQLRTLAYFLLVTETLPPISDQEPAANVKGPRPKALAQAASATPQTRTTVTTGGTAATKTAAAKEGSAKKPAAKKSAAKKSAAKKRASRRSTGGGS